MTVIHCSGIARWTAGRIAVGFARDGVQRWCLKPHINRTSPEWFLATTAKADLELFSVVSTLSLTQPMGGGVHVEMGCTEGVGVKAEKVLESSTNLESTFCFALCMSALLSWKWVRFLVLQISSISSIILSGVVHWSWTGNGELGGRYDELNNVFIGNKGGGINSDTLADWSPKSSSKWTFKEEVYTRLNSRVTNDASRIKMINSSA